MNQRLRGTLQVALAALSWSFAGVLCKWLPWNSLTINGFRSLFSALLLGLARGGFRVRLTRGTVLGALGVALTSLFFICATKLTSSANAIVLQYAMPAFVIAFLWIFFGQRPSKRNLLTAACVLCGVILCSWEGLTGSGSALGDAMGILAAISFALVFFCSRLPDANTADYTYLGCAMGIPFALCAAGDPAFSLAPVQWLAMLGMAACLAGGYFFIGRGMANTSPVTAAILANLEPVLNPLWVFLFLGERPGVLTLAGMAVVLTAATIYSILGVREADPQ